VCKLAAVLLVEAVVVAVPLGPSRTEWSSAVLSEARRKLVPGDQPTNVGVC
jgi:hypothetical protein